MPLYQLINNKSGEEESVWLSYDEMKQHLKDNPDWAINFSNVKPGLHSGIGLGVRKVDEGFKDLLGEMKKTHGKRGGKIDNRR